MTINESVYIVKSIGEPAALEQLAEECAELAQAALKLARVLRAENPTPVTEEDARKMQETICARKSAMCACAFACSMKSSAM